MEFAESVALWPRPSVRQRATEAVKLLPPIERVGAIPATCVERSRYCYPGRPSANSKAALKFEFLDLEVVNKMTPNW
jgi:hypothetical protein